MNGTDGIHPFKGLSPYSEEDALFFFGRESERRVVISNLFAARLTVLYGSTGVGKSSLLAGGVMHEFARRAREAAENGGVPDVAAVLFKEWQGDVLSRLKDAIRAAVLKVRPGFQDTAVPLAGLFEAIASYDLDTMVILDQFDEYFAYNPAEDGNTHFARELAEAVNRTGSSGSLLISIRDDSLSKLDRFKKTIPDLFGNYLRLKPLNATAAKEAIQLPLVRFNSLQPAGSTAVTIEPALVDRILKDVKAGNLTMSGRAPVLPASLPDTDSDEYQVDAPYLQLVMSRLWDEEMSRGSQALTLRTLEDLGGAATIVRTHLDRIISSLTSKEQDVAAVVFHYLVTPSGGKIAHAAEDLAKFANVKNVDPVLEKLASGNARILRTVTAVSGPNRQSYEIFHDVLAPAILDWRQRYLRRVEIRKRRRAYLVACASVAFALVFALLGLYAWKTTRQSRSRELAISAGNNLERDPALSLTLALHAVTEGKCGICTVPAEAEEALHRGLQASQLRRTLTGHAVGVAAVAFSPNGKLLATGGQDGVLILWNVADGVQTAALRGHEGEITGVAFHPSKSLVATSGVDRTARIWDVASGKEVLVLRGHEGAVTSVAFSSDGARLVTSSKDKTARVWDSDSGKQLLVVPHGDWVHAAAFDRTGFYVVTGSEGFTRLLDTTSGYTLGLLLGHGVHAVALSPDGQHFGQLFGQDFAIAGAGADVQIWNIAVDQVIQRFPNNHGTITGVAYNSDGTKLAMGGTDGTATLWDVVSGRQLGKFAGHRGAVKSVAFSPDGSLIATAGVDRTAKLWSTEIHEEVSVLHAAGIRLNGLSFSPDSTRIATGGSDGIARIWQLGDRSLKTTKPPHQGAVLSVAFDPAGNRFATASSDHLSKIWDAGTGSELLTLSGHRDPVGSVAFSLDGRYVATASDDKTVKVWDSRTGGMLRNATHADYAVGVAFSANGNLLGSASWDGTAVIWDAASLQQRLKLVHAAQVRAIAFGPDGRLATGTSDKDNAVRIWDTASGKELLTLTGHTQTVSAVGFSPNGRRLASGSEDTTAKVWDAYLGKELFTIAAHTAPVRSVVFSPDGKFLATAGDDGSVRLFAMDLDELIALARSRIAAANRALTRPECAKYLHTDACPTMP